MSGIQEYSITPASNTSDWPEAMPPSRVNNSARQDRADLRAWYNDPSWIEYGKGDGAGDGVTADYVATYVSTTSLTIGTDVTAAYNAGRRIRVTIDGAEYLYSNIASSSYSAPDTTVTLDDAILEAGALRVWLGADAGGTASGIPGSAIDGQVTSPQLKGPTETTQTAAPATNTVAFTVADGGIVTTTLDQNITTVTVTWGTGARSFTLIVKQDGTGGRTWAWPSGWLWPFGQEPTITAAAGSTDIFTVFSPDGGTTVYAATAGLAFA